MDFINWVLLWKIATICSIIWIPTVILWYFKKIKPIYGWIKNKLQFLSVLRWNRKVILYKWIWWSNLMYQWKMFKNWEYFVANDSMIYDYRNKKKIWINYEVVKWEFAEVENISNIILKENWFGLNIKEKKIFDYSTIPKEYIKKKFIRINEKFLAV